MYSVYNRSTVAQVPVTRKVNLLRYIRLYQIVSIYQFKVSLWQARQGTPVQDPQGFNDG